MGAPESDKPFYDRRRLPSVFAPSAVALPVGLRAQLETYCAFSGEDPAAVIADAVALHLDELAAGRQS